MNNLFIFIVFAFSIFFQINVHAEVKAYEKEISIPTWETGPLQVHSNFFDSGSAIYPYTLNEILTNHKVDKTYKGVFLENEFIQVLILPEIGGRLHGARDKTNGYVWMYWQETIKPGLIGMTGAWISGGIEWNFPHGHRPSCFMPVDWRIVHHDDGSATVWVGETDRIYGMRWLVGMTAFPGRSNIRCDYIFINPTNQQHSFQFWATSATHANEWTQAQYPGDMVTGHGKHQFWNWPIHDGIDLTWWKNSPNASSYFAFNNPSDWFGTYDHRENGGMIHVADHHIMPGKKLWTWGSGPSGRIWEDILTEGGGPYFEPQAGAWSDNQPDYHWMWPNEVKTAHDYWYPVRDTRGIQNANKDFAVNTDLKDGKAFGAVYPTGIVPNAKIVLKNTRTDVILSNETKAIAPDKPYTVEVETDEGDTVYDLHLAVYDAQDNLCIELQQQKPKQVDLPPGDRDPGDPKKMNQDQLYRSGEWLDKFRRTKQGLTYYQEALKKDPGDTRVNIEMGYLALKQGKWNEALQYLNRARERDNDNSRIYFGNGLAYVGLQDFAKAYDMFYRATYTYRFFSAAYYNLAKIDLRRGEFKAAIEKLDEAISQNGKFADLYALKAAAFRHQGKRSEALHAADHAMELDPLNFMAACEKMLVSLSINEPERSGQRDWERLMRDEVQNYLTLATAYANAGLYQTADSILAMFSNTKADSELNPMVNYFRGYFQELLGNSDQAADFYVRAQKGLVDYTNPHRLEGKAALEAAIRYHEQDANAHLFLGNLLYASGQLQDGFAHWLKAAQYNDRHAHAWRNIGYGERFLNHDLNAALQAYEKTLEINPQDARALLEYETICETLQKPVSERLQNLENQIDVVNTRDDLISRLIDLRLLTGDKDRLSKAYQTLRNHHFHSWEGKYGVHHAWVEVNQKLGDLAFDAKDFQTALKHYEEACLYPENLEVAARTPDFRAHVNWNLAKTYLAMNEKTKAEQFLKQIISEKYTRLHLGSFYQALAYKALDNSEKYNSIINQLEKQAQKLTSGEFEYRGNRKAIGHYLYSLILEERNNTQEAAAQLQKALEQNPRIQRSAIHEAQLDIARAHQ